MLTNIKAQIDNSLQFGWKKDDLLVVTNFPFVYKNIGSIQLKLNKNCLTGSKLFAINELFKFDIINEEVWCHDLDAWQVSEFNFPKFKDIGIAFYSTDKINVGSVFYKKNRHWKRCLKGNIKKGQL